jgi:hypothetical protein
MQSSTRRPGLLSRFAIRSNNPRPRRGVSAVVDHFNNLHLREDDNDDTASVHTVLPPYSPRSNLHYIRPSSPTPTYYSVDESERSSATDDTPSQPSLLRPYSQVVIEECVTRISESLRNPRAWRRLGGRESSYFWALRLRPGTADILDEHIDEIRNRIFGTRDCNVAQFGIIFKGHKLVELWCRPVHSRVAFFQEVAG